MNSNNIVTDGAIVRFSARMHDLYTRFKKGVVKTEPVLEGLQRLIEGRDPIIPLLPTSSLFRYKVWKTIRIGGVTHQELKERIFKGWRKTPDHNSFDFLDFRTQDLVELVDLVVFTPEEFGYTEPPSQESFFNQTRLSRWSAENLNGYVLELCTAEVGPHLWEQYGNCDKEQGTVAMAMEPIEKKNTFSHENSKHVFCIWHTESGHRNHACHLLSSDGKVQLYERYVFRLRKL